MRTSTLFLILTFAPLFASGPVRAQEALPAPTSEVLLTIRGKIEKTNSPKGATFDRAMLEGLGLVKVETTTTFTKGRKVFEGVPLRAVLSRVGARGTTLKATALNDYTAVLPLDDLKHEPILAMRMDGVVLTARDKGPLWIVYPKDRLGSVVEGAEHDAKWVWQLDRLDVE
jgi:hypothetical protein